jgi:hypothetical protein
MKMNWIGARLRAHARLMVASVAVLSGCGGVPEEGFGSAEPIATTSEAFTEYGPNQAKANAFYAPDNIVDVTINLPDATWTTIKTESPAGGACTKVAVDSAGETPNRYPWRAATSVTITDSKGTTNATFSSGVDIRKKSFCGSLTTGENEQPSIKLRINSTAARDALGVQYIDLNNSKQDPSFVRQNLGYFLYGLAGLPRPRVNYAKVHVVTPTKTDHYIAVNVEPIRGSFINNPDNGFTIRTITQSGSSDAKAPGNLYEFFLDDFDPNMLTYVGLEKISAIQTSARADLAYARDRIGTGTVAGLTDVVNIDQFAKFWAMEVLLKHWDGYTQNKNNTFIYNDVVATSGTQSASTVDFKFIPWGIDQILQPGRFKIPDFARISTIMRSDPTQYAKFITAVQNARLNVFSRANLDGVINTRLNLLRDQLLYIGKDSSVEIDKIRIQLKLARAAAIILSGSGSGAFYLADVNSGNVIHASNSESVGIYKEIYHRPPANDPSDRWIPGSISDGVSVYSTLVNEAYGRPLYATASAKTPAGNYYMFTEPNGNYPPGEGWAQYYDITYHANGGVKDFSGTFNLRSTRTSRYAHFSSTDLTPAGRPRVYQGATNGSNATPLFMY